MSKVQRPLAEARELAERVVREFRHSCERIEIAGSIRRRKAMVGDIEIVCIPKRVKVPDPEDLFGERTITVNVQFEHVTALVNAGIYEHRLNVNGSRCFGASYQRLAYQGFGLDIFCTDAERWGVTFAVRTGNAEFSRKLMTVKSQGGFLLPGQFVKDWRLWGNATGLYETPEETDFFDAICLPWIDPSARSGEHL